MERGQIVKNKSNYFWIANENNEIKMAQASKMMTYNKQKILIGDFVEYLDDQEKPYIKKILPRYNMLIRPLVANVEYGLIVTSVIEPKFNRSLLDRIIAVLVINKITPIIVITKLDLLTKEEIIKVEKEIGDYQIYPIIRNNQSDFASALEAKIKNKLTFLIGNSGVGKSTIVNKLNNNELVPTNQISQKLGRGKHTTRHAEVHFVGKMRLIDTPGFGMLDLKHYGVTKNNLKNGFKEFEQYTCKYKDCIHNQEPNCQVKENAEKFKKRYESYIELIHKMEEK